MNALGPALELCFLVPPILLPPPWFVPIEFPACGAILDVPGGETKDGVARRFVCDRRAGHDREHRQVVDNEAGRALAWGDDESSQDLEWSLG